jgi:hypothetical protein
MLPVKVKVNKTIIKENYPDVTDQDLEGKSDFEYISKEEVMKQIDTLKGQSFGFATKILQQLKYNIEKL